MSQIDIMPSLASLCGEEVKYSGLGKNIFENDSASDHYAFIIDSDLGNIGLVTDNYFFKYNRKTKEEAVYPLLNNEPLKKGEPADSLLKRMRNLTLGYYEASRYLLFNNKKKK